MRSIAIAHHHRPFSHHAGVRVWIPGTTHIIDCFPSLYRKWDVTHADERLLEEQPLPLNAPCENCTIQTDLEKGTIRGWVKTFSSDRPSELFKWKLPVLMPTEKLSLGSHCLENCEKMLAQLDLHAIFPLLHRLGQLVPLSNSSEISEGPWALLQQSDAAIKAKQHDKILGPWRQLIRGYFSDLLVPRLQDTQFQGFPGWTPPETLSPLLLLQEAYSRIRTLFIRNVESQLDLLPSLPPEFHCGRLINAQVSGGVVSLEWTKKQIRRLEVISHEPREWTFTFPHFKQCRLRSKGSKGSKVLSVNQSILLSPNELYTLDNFC